MTPQQLLTQLYADFNARNTEAVLAQMAPDVEWPASTEGSGYVTGPAEVGAYWARQWTTLDPHVDPLSFTRDDHGRAVVEVHLVVHDKGGKLLADQVLHHVYTFNENGLVRRMDIEALP
ncbi:MAG TPA: nuclear transport factor 2 family protein [Acidobacteriaceae bacterium]|nr:nuclear transport factor 2 family protein [Acidobacteriaceae bacterium]